MVRAAVQPTKRTVPKPIYVIFGAEAFLRETHLEEVLQKLLGDHRDDGMSMSEFEGDSAELADVLDACRTPSLLCSLRVVCVKEADDFISKHRKELENYLNRFIKTDDSQKQPKRPPATLSGVLVLICRSWPKTTRLYKLVNSVGFNISCEVPKGPQGVLRWAVQHADQAYGCKLSSIVATRLVDLVGDDLGRLDMEISKLATYVLPKKTIQMESVDELIGASRAEIVFRITDAIADHDAQTALALWKRVLATDRSAAYRSVGGLAYGFRRLAEAKRLVAGGMSAEQVKKNLRFWGGDSSGLARQLSRFSLAQWRDHLVKLLRIDLGAKTGLGDVQSSVEKMIVELCSAS